MKLTPLFVDELRQLYEPALQIIHLDDLVKHSSLTLRL